LQGRERQKRKKKKRKEMNIKVRLPDLLIREIQQDRHGAKTNRLK
jgi:hypothetical protein